MSYESAIKNDDIKFPIILNPQYLANKFFAVILLKIELKFSINNFI